MWNETPAFKHAAGMQSWISGIFLPTMSDKQQGGKEGRRKRKKVIVSRTKVENSKPCYPSCSQGFDWSFLRSCSNLISNMTLGWGGAWGVAGTMPHYSKAPRQPPLKAVCFKCDLFSVYVTKGPISFMKDQRGGVIAKLCSVVLDSGAGSISLWRFQV